MEIVMKVDLSYDQISWMVNLLKCARDGHLPVPDLEFKCICADMLEKFLERR
jgi:hypothetical protein